MQDLRDANPSLRVPYAAAGCISHHDISTSMHGTRERASWKFARSESDPRLMKRNKQKNRPRGRDFTQGGTLLWGRRYAFGWRIRGAQHAGSPAYNGPPLLFCTRPPRLQLNARYQRLSGEKQSLHGCPCVYICILAHEPTFLSALGDTPKAEQIMQPYTQREVNNYQAPVKRK